MFDSRMPMTNGSRGGPPNLLGFEKLAASARQNAWYAEEPHLQSTLRPDRPKDGRLMGSLRGNQMLGLELPELNGWC